MWNAFKQFVARKAAQRAFVRHLVRDEALRDPGFLDPIRQQLRQELLADPAFQHALLDAFSARPDLAPMITRHPPVFQALLVEYLRNPEALFALLSRGPGRAQLRAQGAFLQEIAQDLTLMRAILQRLPTEHLPALLRAVLDAPMNERLGHGRVTGAGLLGGQVVAVLTADDTGAFAASLPPEDPALGPVLMADPVLREAVVAQLAADRESVADLLQTALRMPALGDTVSARLGAVLALITDLPAFRAALGRDPALRAQLAALVQSADESTGAA